MTRYELWKHEKHRDVAFFVQMIIKTDSGYKVKGRWFNTASPHREPWDMGLPQTIKITNEEYPHWIRYKGKDICQDSTEVKK